MRFVYVPLFLSFAVTACSGGGGTATDIVTREEFVPIIPVEDIVPTGSATYQGGIGLAFLAPSTGAAVDLDGDLTLTVDFDNPTTGVTGSATGFQQDTTIYTGNLLINAGALDDSAGGYDFNTNINGSLLTGTTNYLVLGQMRGEVLGAGQVAASGSLSGDVIERGTQTPLSGDFQAARNP